ncbi:aspartyl protease family protein At5g10770-like [Mangifera indica]|uniref:aspartyl protease family protein At5g10770-like n=1 Tax=Mangifera indica TaxID=29780 RepID=UPI001CF97C9B|nr:aspartyl protease family protein At5g10770-like [Mangifera indica]
MATRISIFYLRFLLRASFLYLCLLPSVKNSSAEQYNESEGHRSHSHNVKVCSLLPSTVCNHTSTKGQNKASLKVLSKYSPCSTLNQGKIKTPNYLEILRKDRARASYIQSRIFRQNEAQAITVDTKPILSYEAPFEFYITVSLGTPRQNVNLLLDTGSGFTWTQCKPCLECFKQKTQLFDPSKSSTYSAVPCESPACFERRCISDKCIYRAEYVSGRSSGIVSTDRLTITNGFGTFVKYPHIFGCGNNNSADIDGATGLMGLSRSPLSFISQTSQKYFSYCFPSSYGSTGYLTFGKTDEDIRNKFIKFTPMSISPQLSDLYDITVTGITVAGKMLPIANSEYSKSGAFIDSGSTFTTLPGSTYVALRSAFRKEMSKYKMIKPVKSEDIDTCYDFSSKDRIVIPKISIFFKGEVELELDVKGIMIAFKKDLSQVCLAFEPNTIDSFFVLGNNQLRAMEVHYDLAGERLGFGPGSCS